MVQDRTGEQVAGLESSLYVRKNSGYVALLSGGALIKRVREMIIRVKFTSLDRIRLIALRNITGVILKRITPVLCYQKMWIYRHITLKLHEMMLFFLENIFVLMLPRYPHHEWKLVFYYA